jgi:hypothetical protein
MGDQTELLEQYIKKLHEQKVGYADKWLNYYNSWQRTKLPYVLFRIVGIFVILGSVSLPLLAQVTTDKVYISLVSLGVAFFTALTSFFSWNLTWQRRVTAIVALRHYIACWEIDMLKASKENYDYGKEQAYNATSQLFTMVFTTVSAETQASIAQLKPLPPPEKGNQTLAP